MKILFLSNFYNHHQASISRELYQQTEKQYRFVATELMPEDRIKLGYADIGDEFVVQYNEDPVLKKQIQQWIDEADAVIIGAAPEYLIENRKKTGKLILRYSERPLKYGFQLWKYPFQWLRWNKINPRRAYIYMLCASAYTASDYAKFGLFNKRTLKWGYFPECKNYVNIMELIDKKNRTELLWCGRFLDWKHPDYAILIATRLKEANYDFHLTMVGTGEMENQLKKMVADRGLINEVNFTGSVPSNQVRSYMEKAGIYLLTSDRKEGWGAVLNEAMNSGCAVLASRDAGSVPYLISDDYNGMIYDSCSVDMLYEKTAFLLDHPIEQKRLGLCAYETITKVWNAKEAARRLVQIADGLCRGSLEFFEEGPCSRA